MKLQKSISAYKTLETDISTDGTLIVDTSDDELPITTIYSNNKTKKSVKLCTICGQKLPLSNFYKSSSNEDGYIERCKKCDDKSNAAKVLIEIQKYIEIGKPFNQNELSEKIDNITKAKYYLWTLQEQDLIEYQEKTQTYILEKNERFEDYLKFLKEESFDKASDNAPIIDAERSEHPSDVSYGVEIDNPDCKEIIYISEIVGSIYTNILMKAIIKNENILPTLLGIESIISSNMKKLLINRNKTNFSEIIIDLEIKNESLDEILNSLEYENWKNINLIK